MEKEQEQEQEQEFEEPISLNFCYGINECFGSVWVVTQSQDEKEETGDGSEQRKTESIKDKTTEGKKDISVIYSVDNNLVVLNRKKQTLYRGHFNKISKITKSRKNNFLASCDKGPDSFILLWKINGDSLEPFKKLKRVNFAAQHISEKEKSKKKSICVNDENTNRNDKNEKNGVYNRNDNKKSIKREKSSFSESPSTQTEDEEDVPSTGVEGRDRSKRGQGKKEDILGFETIDISYDNRYLCAISEEKPYLKTEGKKCKMSNPCFQEILIFDLNEEHNYIVCSDKIYGVEKQTKIQFNKNYEIVSNSKKKLYFYHFDKKNKTITHYSPSLYKTNKTKENFIFTESSFIENSTEVITGTQNGFLIIWNYSNIFLNKNKNTVKQREYQKYLEIKKHVSINVVLNYGNYIILGLQDGSVQVFDTQLKCYAWFENKNIGSIRSVDFEHSDFQKDFIQWNSFIVFSEKNIIKRIFPSTHTTYFLTNEEKGKTGKPTDVHINADIGADVGAGVGADANADINTNKYIFNEILLQFHSTSISSFCTNYMEDENILIIGSTNGKIEVFDFDKNETITVFNLKQKEIAKMTFNNKGDILCVGCKCGFVFLIDAISALRLKNRKEKKGPSHGNSIKKIDIKQINEIETDTETATETDKEREGSECEILFSSKDIKQEIHFICFSEDDRILVCCSLNGNLIIYKKESNKNSINNQDTSSISNKNASAWKYAHKIVNDNNFRINDLTVTKNLKKYYVYTIVTITNTKHIVFYSYDYQNNAISISYLKNEQTATSTCLTGDLYFYSRQMLCICNDHSKLRFFDVENKQIVKTVHLPFKNKHIQAFLLLRQKKEKKNKQEAKLETPAAPEKQENGKKEKSRNYITEKRMKSFGNFFNQKNNTTFQENSMELLKNDLSEDGPNLCPNSTTPSNFEKNDFNQKNLFLFVLDEKMVVFTMNPLNANCFMYIGVIVCSDIINDIIFKNNCIFILSKNHIFYFQLNGEAIKSYIDMQNNTLQTFINQIGGENGPLYKQIINSFYYCEIQKKKNENRKEKHNIKKILNILSIEYIFASINVFLSKFEIQNIIQEYHFYYKYVKNILIQNGVPINEKIKIGEQTLVSYKADDDLLLQNIFFLQDSESEGNGSKNVSEKKKQKKERILQKKVVRNKKEEETDIAEECKNIYFNVNAFIYTYFNFPEEEKINMEETITEIINYYKKKMKKTDISYNDFLYILKNFGESMEQGEFKRIFQIFSKNNQFLNLEEKMELHQLQNLFQ